MFLWLKKGDLTFGDYLFLGFLLHTSERAVLSSYSLHLDFFFCRIFLISGDFLLWRCWFFFLILKNLMIQNVFPFYAETDVDGCTVVFERKLYVGFFSNRDSRVWKNKWKLRSLLTRLAVSLVFPFFFWFFSMVQHNRIPVFGVIYGWSGVQTSF
jgi:hypothetical protein